jgi:hypothetical protein
MSATAGIALKEPTIEKVESSAKDGAVRVPVFR